MDRHELRKCISMDSATKLNATVAREFAKRRSGSTFQTVKRSRGFAKNHFLFGGAEITH